MKNFDDMLNRFLRISACDRQLDGRTDSVVHSKDALCVSCAVLSASDMYVFTTFFLFVYYKHHACTARMLLQWLGCRIASHLSQLRTCYVLLCFYFIFLPSVKKITLKRSGGFYWHTLCMLGRLCNVVIQINEGGFRCLNVSVFSSVVVNK